MARQASTVDLLTTATRSHELTFCQADGIPSAPDYVTHRFRKLESAARVPVIKLHEARHSAHDSEAAGRAVAQVRATRPRAGERDRTADLPFTSLQRLARRKVRALLAAAMGVLRCPLSSGGLAALSAARHSRRISSSGLGCLKRFRLDQLPRSVEGA